MTSDLAELIVYACPTGELAAQLVAYYERAALDCARNEAHRYPAHVTLTGFFHDVLASVPVYRRALSEAVSAAPCPPDVRVAGVMYEPHFHGLLIASPWLQALTADFATRAASPSRVDALRLKDWLHVSLAYGFPEDRHECLERIGREMVDPGAPAAWELRLYERRPGDAWTCHAAWPLDGITQA